MTSESKKTFTYSELEQWAQIAAFNNYSAGIAGRLAPFHREAYLQEVIRELKSWSFDKDGRQVRTCSRCGDVLAESDDLICGYHHLEN